MNDEWLKMDGKKLKQKNLECNWNGKPDIEITFEKRGKPSCLQVTIKIILNNNSIWTQILNLVRKRDKTLNIMWRNSVHLTFLRNLSLNKSKVC